MIDSEVRLWYVCFAETNPHNGDLACLYYMTCSQNSKTNLSIPEKEKNAEYGSSTRCSQSLFRLPHLTLQICFDASKHSLGLPSSVKNDFTPSWLHPKFRGIDFGLV